MDPRLFARSRYGTIVTDPLLAWDHLFFKPAAIPRELELAQATNDIVQRASLELGRLSGLSQLIHDPALLLGPAMAQEAVSSSRIEGTQAGRTEDITGMDRRIRGEPADGGLHTSTQ